MNIIIAILKKIKTIKREKEWNDYMNRAKLARLLLWQEVNIKAPSD